MSFPSSYYETRFTLVGAPAELPDRFAIVTAHNPMDRRWSPRMNATADHRLRRLLQRKLLPHFRAIGHAPDHSHAEAGWGIETDLETALALARRFRQRALWWVDFDALHLVAARGAGHEMLGRFRPRVTGRAPAP